MAAKSMGDCFFKIGNIIAAGMYDAEVHVSLWAYLKSIMLSERQVQNRTRSVT